MPFEILHAAIADITDVEQVLELVDRPFPICPCGRMGIACNYYCSEGYEATAPVNGRGGYIPPLFLGMKYDTVYPSVILFFVFYF